MAPLLDQVLVFCAGHVPARPYALLDVADESGPSDEGELPCWQLSASVTMQHSPAGHALHTCLFLEAATGGSQPASSSAW